MYRIVSKTISIGVDDGFSCSRGRIDFNFLSSILARLDLVFLVEFIRAVEVLVICLREEWVDRSKEKMCIMDVDGRIHTYTRIYIESMIREVSKERKGEREEEKKREENELIG